MKRHFTLYLIVGCVVFFSSCRKDIEVTDDTSSDSLNLSQVVFDYMHEWYLWNDEIPSFDTTGLYLQSDLSSALALVDTLRKKDNPVDRWSYIEEQATYTDYFENGKYEGFGVSMSVDADDQLRVGYVYEDSPFYRAGVRRSWIFSSIDGVAVESLIASGNLSAAFDNSTSTFVFIAPNGESVTKTITKSEVGINSVLFRNVYEVDGQKVGYLVFNNFIETSRVELQDAFQYFKEEGISEMILDLRYNGGGRISIAEYIAANLLGSKSSGQTFLKYLYSDSKASENQVYNFTSNEFSFDLDRVFFITSGGTASSSELVINGIKPFADVFLIGDDTYGKPVGSRPASYGGYTISLINFQSVNQLDQGGYFDGLPADAYVQDDLTREFGDPEEARLKEALYYIANGSFSGVNARHAISQNTSWLMTGFRREIGAY